MPGRQEHLQAQIYRLNILLVERLSASVVDCNAVEDILVSTITQHCIDLDIIFIRSITQLQPLQMPINNVSTSIHPDGS
jgi:hypothetical protein